MFGWTPTIGDPTTLGWATVVAYAAAALACWFAGRQAPRREERWWWALAIILALLAVNKQLDLQTLFTDIGRWAARSGGWYEQRRPIQRKFIEGVMAVGAIAAILLLVLARKARTPVKTALAGLVLLGVFILVRASSFEKMDQLINTRLGTARANHWMELGGIAIIGLSALWSLKPARSTRRR